MCDVVGHREKCAPKCPKETWNRMVNLNHDFTNLVDTVFWSIKGYVYRCLSCQVTKRGQKIQYFVPPFSCQKIIISFHLSNESLNSTPNIYRSTKFEEQNLLICEDLTTSLQNATASSHRTTISILKTYPYRYYTSRFHSVPRESTLGIGHLTRLQRLKQGILNINNSKNCLIHISYFRWF